MAADDETAVISSSISSSIILGSVGVQWSGTTSLSLDRDTSAFWGKVGALAGSRKSQDLLKLEEDSASVGDPKLRMYSEYPSATLWG